MNVKLITYSIFIGCITLLSLVLGIYYYQQNVLAMHKQAESLLLDILKDDLVKKRKELNLPVYSFKKATDTIPLTIHITTKEGKKEYKVDPEKSRKNISMYASERSIYSVVVEEKEISADTIQMQWKVALQKHRIKAETAVHILETDLGGNVSSIITPVTFSRASSQTTCLFYIGCRCEIEVIGFLYNFWWAVCLYYYVPFLLIMVCSISAFLLFHFFYLLAHRPSKIEVIEKEVSYAVIVEKEIVREVVKEKEVIKLVKVCSNEKGYSYQLSSELFFDPHRQVLLFNGKETVLAPQSCVILRLFLDAPNYTVSDEVLLRSIWGNDKTATMKRFTVTYSRLCVCLKSVGCSVAFKRVGTDRYRLLFVDNQ